MSGKQSGAVFTGEWFFLFGEHRAGWCHFGVQRFVIGPLLRKIVFVENGFDRAFGHTRLTVDAFIGVDEQHLLPFVEAFDGAHHDAVGVFAGETRLGNDVGHSIPFLCGLANPGSGPLCWLYQTLTAGLPGRSGPLKNLRETPHSAGLDNLETAGERGK